MFALRQRMVSLATVAVFPPLALLVVLAPVVVPWLFGEAWTAAVLPTQILAAGGAAMMVTDITGSVIMAMGRARAVLIWAIAHFIVYAAAVLMVAGYGLSAVCAAAVGSHTFFLILYYAIMVHGREEKAIPLLLRDIRPALAGCVALGAVAWPLSYVLGSEGVATVPRLVLVACAGMGAYVLALKLWFPDAFRGLWKIIDRLVPTAWLRSRVRRVPALADR
jgi:O-antigen/teichoic acid export membrane protein